MGNIYEPTTEDPSPESNVDMLENGIVNMTIAMSNELQKQGYTLDESKRRAALFLNTLAELITDTNDTTDTERQSND
jgi:hypothetical protein